MRRTSAAFAALLVFLGAACQTTADAPRRRAAAPPSSIDDLERRTFQWFWDTANPRSYLVPDRWPTKSFSSIAAVGFGLTAYCIGAERGYVTREQARDRVLATLRSLMAMPEGSQASGVAQYRGFFYHFLDMETGARYKDVELSTIDTTWLFAGALFCQSYFDRDDATEKAIRDAVEQMVTHAEWDWAQPRPPAITMGWYPEKGFHTYDWRGYNEAMMVIILALGSPAHPVDPAAWSEYTRTYQWGSFYGQEHVLFAPLFGHQYTQMFIDFRGIQDAYMRGKGIDYFENSRRATLSQRAYANDNPGRWKDYGGDVWGLTACDGPGDMTIDSRTYHSYWGRGATAGDIRDDGTIAPTAAASSIAFTPDISIAAIAAMQHYPGIYRQYGFADAFNPTFKGGWGDPDYLGIDQGPIIAMIENYRSELVWKTMKKNPHVVRGLKRAGFTGGWLEQR
ncbi:MAG: Tat pathway signal protein [Acidobacteria bacterium]|nr:MAG: Tat pathway signal protein [Acidobacteriota bacterium]